MEAAKRYLNPQQTTTDPNSLGDDGFKGFGSWNDILNEMLYARTEDVKKYQEYDLMDNEIPEITASLDVMADYVIYPDATAKTTVFKVKPTKKYDNKTNTKIIEDIKKTTNFDAQFWACVRETCKYGDDFEEILRFNDKRVAGISNIDTSTVMVNLGSNGLVDGIPYTISQLNSANEPTVTLSEEKFLHFSLSSDRKRHRKYGKGVSRLEKSRLSYRQLRLAEEGMIIGRLSRANQNHAIMVDVGDLEPEEALKFIDKYRSILNRRKYIDPQTGRMTYKFNPLSVVEDLYIPTRQGSGAGVTPLNNNRNGGDIDDIIYLQNKMIYSTNVPKILIGKEEDVNSKATADVQFISFLRMIRRIQRLMEFGIKKYFKIAFASYGITDIEFEIEWPVIGTIDEERRWSIEKLKMEVAAMMTTELSLVDDMYVYEKILNFDKETIDEIIARLDGEEEMYKDEINAELTNAEDVTGYPNDGKGSFDPNNPDNAGADMDDEDEDEKEKKPTTKKKVSKTDDKYINNIVLLCKQNPKIKEMLKRAIDLGEMMK